MLKGKAAKLSGCPGRGEVELAGDKLSGLGELEEKCSSVETATGACNFFSLPELLRDILQEIWKGERTMVMFL